MRIKEYNRGKTWNDNNLMPSLDYYYHHFDHYNILKSTGSEGVQEEETKDVPLRLRGSRILNLPNRFQDGRIVPKGGQSQCIVNLISLLSAEAKNI